MFYLFKTETREIDAHNDWVIDAINYYTTDRPFYWDWFVGYGGWVDNDTVLFKMPATFWHELDISLSSN